MEAYTPLFLALFHHVARSDGVKSVVVSTGTSSRLYTFTGEMVPHKIASQVCQEKYGASLTPPYEQQWRDLISVVQNNLKIQNFWIDVTLKTDQGAWTQTDGSALTWEPWASAPQSTTGRCAYVGMDQPSKWQVKPCDEKLPFICQVKGNWRDWSAWTECSCGRRRRRRTREFFANSSKATFHHNQDLKCDIVSSRYHLEDVDAHTTGEMKEVKTASRLRCAAECLASDSCASFTFRAADGSCHLGRVAPRISRSAYTRCH